MSGPKTIWLTDAARTDLRALALRWELSDSATIAESMKRALAEAETKETR